MVLALPALEDAIFGNSSTLRRNFALPLPDLVAIVLIGSCLLALLVRFDTTVLPPRVKRCLHLDLYAALVCILASGMVQRVAVLLAATTTS